MKQKFVDPKTLKIHEKLVKMKSKVNCEKLKVLIAKYGIVIPIDVMEGSDDIIDGVRRWRAAVELGIKKVPVNYISLTKGDVIIDSTLRNTTQKKTSREIAEAALYILAELGTSQGKKRTDFGKFDSDDDFGEVGKDRFALAGKIMDIDFSPVTLRKLIRVYEFDMNSDGILKKSLMDSIDEEGMTISRAYSFVKRIGSEQRDKDEFEKELKDPVVQKDYSVFNVDNKTAHEYMEDKSIDLVYYSPDYGGGIRDYRNVPKENQLGQKNSADYIKESVDFVRSIKSKITDTGSLVINLDDVIRENKSLAIPQRLTAALIDEGWDFIQEVQWKKLNATPYSNFKGFRPSTEKFLHFVKDASKFLWRDYRYETGDGKYDIKKSGKKFYVDSPCKNFENFLSDQRLEDTIETPVFNHKEHKDIDPDYNHQAPQEETIPLLFILHLTKPGMVVCDPFAGSGTTGAVAMRLGRRFVGFDLDPENIDFMKKRFDDLFEENSKEDFKSVEDTYFFNLKLGLKYKNHDNETNSLPAETEYREAS